MTAEREWAADACERCREWCEGKLESDFQLWRDLGTDSERYGEAEIYECVKCGQLWVRYFVEYESFRASGRWAIGKIDRDAAEKIQVDEVTAFLENLPEYIRGGSYFGGTVCKAVGPMPWG